ncbi:MAG: zinc ABC transporter substrate-binding protein [Anaerolineaceae bacterium]
MKTLGIIILCAALLLSACSPAAPEQAQQMAVTVSVLPQAYFVQKIAGDLVSVQAVVGTGDDPHTYEPTAEQMRALTKSRLYFSIGVEFEQAWLPRFSAANPGLEIVDSGAGVERLAISPTLGESAEGAENDPHIWFSPTRVKIISRNIADALAAADPTHAQSYRANLEAWLKEIDAVDADVRAALAGISRSSFLVIHPAWGYFASEYGLTMLSVESHGQEPGPEELGALLNLARENGITTVFVQKGISPKLAQSIAGQLGGARVVELDPMAADWSANMRLLAAELAEALR